MRRLVLAAVTAAAAVLVLPAGAWADANVVHQSTAATTPAGGGFVAPGDHISIIETLRNADSIQAYSGISATLSAVDPAEATVTAATSPYPNMGVLSTRQNSTPFEANLAPSLDCGRPVRFSLDLVTSDPETATIPFVVPTGIADTPVTYPGTGTTIAVAATGYVKDVAVRIAAPSAQLSYVLRAPDGTTVDLTEVPGQPGVFEGDFAALDGTETQGTWRLETGGGPAVGAWSLDLSPATCVREPRAVIAATPRIAEPGDTVTFDATGSTVPSGTVAGYEWDFDGGTDFEVSTAGPTVNHVYATSDTYTARVRVAEGGDVSVASVVIEVTDTPTAALDANPAAPLTGQQVTLDASASGDVDGTIVRYDWDFDGDGTFDATTVVPTTTTSYALPGTRTVAVRVVDDQGATAIATDTVNAQNRPPTAALADPGVVGKNRPVLLDAGGSADPDDGIVAYAWDLDGNAADFEVTGTSATRSHTFPAAGAVPIRVRVTDASGAQVVATRTVTVTEPPTAALTAGPNPARPGRTVSYDASGSGDLDGSIATYAWDLDGDGVFEASGATATRTRSFAVGTWGASVRVTDDLGVSTTSAVVNVVVQNLLPVAALALSQPVVAGQVASFDASGSADPDGDPPASYAWDLDNNGSFELQTGTSPVAGRAYPNAGTITVRVRVTDSDGGTDVEQLVFTVGPAPGSGGSGGSSGSGSGGSGSGGTASDAPGFADLGADAGGSGGAGTVPGRPGTGAAGAGGDDGSTAGSTPRGTLRASLLGAAIQATRLARTRGLGLLCRADRAATCTVTATLALAVARRLRLVTRSDKGPVVIGRATGTASAGTDARLVVRLTAKAQRGLKGADRVLVTLRGSARTASGQRVAITRTVLLRRR